jgi:hypothetical protein
MVSVYSNVFGRAPSDYLVTQGLGLCKRLKITSIARLPEVLGRDEFREQLSNEYRLLVGMNPSTDEIFVSALYAMARGDREGIKHIRRVGRREYDAVESFARREILTSLPNSVEELIEQLEDPREDEVDIEGWADALGATGQCAICNTMIIDPYAFGEAVMYHYKLADPEASEVQKRIERAIYGSSAETGGVESSSLCSYHADQMAKDN